ncbi:patatin-like phospholipase family protein [Xinfangfangia sp. CPCC 101601]|uniref:Patatin-like phospholipase family protein n=1 Tax=Pseudogemmobacter lacusdianii TaxID=3069608 RepID=A0ABU0VUL3_9RHOB|nr:patatin-like phospholipase family protein [Xinfangfangia sp. CPCC 101601]MDQ2065419.1 patatin-like phospholipase family protein [Xinfangfangia sp. CPCC 101601]
MSGAQRDKVSLALQGGGAHGAFTWGVLDRLLEEDRFEIAAISGTSAGALNGAALKAGMVQGGADEARRVLRQVWEAVAAIGDFRSMPWVQPFVPGYRFWQQAAESLLPFNPAGLMTQLWSPYSAGVDTANPLEPVINLIDFDAVAAAQGPRLYIGATNVRSGKVRLFRGTEVTPLAVMASACLPTAFRAVEIEGEAYWDGGFSGNPSLWPLFHAELPDDIVVVQVNPLRREVLPETPLDIQNRVNEIGFNAPLMGELRAIAFVHRLIEQGRIEEGQMKDVRIHLIADDALMNELSGSSKLQPTGELIEKMYQAGRARGADFLTRAKGGIAATPPVDLRGMLT